MERSDSNSNSDRNEGRLDTILSEMSACSNKTVLQYKTLSDNVFFWTTLFLHLGVVISAMLIPNIDIVLELTGAIGCSANTFLFPGVAFLLALRKYDRPSIRQRWSTFFYKVLAWLFLIIFVTLLAAVFYLEI